MISVSSNDVVPHEAVDREASKCIVGVRDDVRGNHFISPLQNVSEISTIEQNEFRWTAGKKCTSGIEVESLSMPNRNTSFTISHMLPNGMTHTCASRAQSMLLKQSKDSRRLFSAKFKWILCQNCYLIFPLLFIRILWAMRPHAIPFQSNYFIMYRIHLRLPFQPFSSQFHSSLIPLRWNSLLLMFGAHKPLFFASLSAELFPWQLFMRSAIVFTIDSFRQPRV